MILGSPANVLDFGAIQTSVNANSNTYVPAGTYDITNPILLNQNNKITGDGERLTIIHNIGTSQAVTTPTSTPGGTKSYAQGMINFQITGTNTTTPFAQALFVQQTGNTSWEKGIIQNHNTLVDLKGAVGTTLKDVFLVDGTNGLRTNGINSMDATNLTNFTGGGIITTDTAVVINGVTKALHFNETDFGTNNSLYNDFGVNDVLNLVFRNCWFEGNTITDLGISNSPVVDSCYMVGEITFAGGFAPTFNNITINGSGNFQQFYTNPEIAYTTVTGQTFNNVGQHGLSLTMPKIGAASTPVDRYAPQQTAQSALIGELGGTLFGYSQPLQNLIGNKVSVTTFDPAGYWPYGGATVTIGQVDMYGGTGATKLQIGSGNGTHGSSSITTSSGKWYVVQMAFKMVAANESIGFYAQSQGGTLDKRNSYQIPDTNLRVVHMLLKADNTAVRLFIALPTSGVIVERICMFEGQELKPMIKEGANYNLPFLMEFNNVVSYSAAAPITGTWAVGDRVYAITPTSGGTPGWVCTTAGTPGSWKAMANLA